MFFVFFLFCFFLLRTPQKLFLTLEAPQATRHGSNTVKRKWDPESLDSVKLTRLQSIYCSSFNFNPLTSGSIATSSGYAGSQTEDTDPDFFPNFNDVSLGKSAQTLLINASTISASLSQIQSAWVSPQSISDRFDTAQKILMANYASNYGYSSSLVGPAATQYSGVYPGQRLLSNSGANEELFEAGTAFGIHRPRAESFNAASHGRFKSVSSDTTYDLLKERDPRVGFNAQSCTPNFDKEARDQQVLAPQKISSFQAAKPAKQTEKSVDFSSTYQNEASKSVAEKLKQYKLNKIRGPDYKESSSVQMPQKYYQLFQDLTQTLNERTNELEETKSRLEAVVVALVMNKGTDIIENGTFDAQEMAHQITSKLSTLLAENETLQRMVSYSNKQSLLVELNLLREENESLKKSVEELKKA